MLWMNDSNPLPIFAPAQAGTYEIRYKMRDTGEVAARIEVVVEPQPFRGG